MERIGPQFENHDYQKRFDQFGFIKIPLLSQEEVTCLKLVYSEVKEAHDQIAIPFITTSHSNNPDLITKVNDEILAIVADKIYEQISGSSILFSNFLVKKPGKDSESNPHQDINIVDESKYLSFSVWIALDDNNPLNGAMRLLAKSHMFDLSIRANSNDYWKYSQLHVEIKKDMLACPTKAGEAIIFAHSTIHGSYPNLSKLDRLACVVSLYPKDASLLNYYVNEEDPNLMQKYVMSDKAFINYIKGEAPHFGAMIEEFKYTYEQVDKATYEQMKRNVNR